MGRYLDRWRKYPTTSGPASRAQINAAYTKAIRGARASQKTVAPGSNFEYILRIRRKPHYYIGTLFTKEIRDFRADNWREYWFNVIVRGPDLYARRKGT